MAFYTYKCSCTNSEPFEVMARPSEIPLKNCPRCGKENPIRVWCANIVADFPQGGAVKTSSFWDKNRKGLDK